MTVFQVCYHKMYVETTLEEQTNICVKIFELLFVSDMYLNHSYRFFHHTSLLLFKFLFYSLLTFCIFYLYDVGFKAIASFTKETYKKVCTNVRNHSFIDFVHITATVIIKS